MAAPKKKKKKSTLFLVIMIICLGVIAFAAYQLITLWLQYRQAGEEYEELRGYTSEADPVPTETAEEPAEEVEEELAAPIDVDWDSLLSINQDVVGWLYIGSMDISYPIARSKDNDYYLHRTIEGTYNFAGSIFEEHLNSPKFTDPNTIIYGHNMKDGSMFGRLKFLTEDNKVQDDPYFWVLTPEHNYRYQIFNVGITNLDSDIYTLFSQADNKFLKKANAWQDGSSVELEKVTFDENSRVVTLSTCTSNESQRYIVQGVRQEK